MNFLSFKFMLTFQKYASNSHLRRHKHSKAKARRRKFKDSKKRASSEGPHLQSEKLSQEATSTFAETPDSECFFEYECAIALSSAATPAGERVSKRAEKVHVSSAQPIEMVRPESVVEEPRQRKMTEVSESGNETDVDVV